MAVTGLDFTTSMEVSLRDTSAGSSIYGSHTLKVIHVTGATGTYSSGGVVLDPTWFGFTALNFVNCQSSLSMNMDNAMLKVCEFGLNSEPDGNGGLNWRWTVFTFDGDGYAENADGSSVSFPEGLTVTYLLIGS